MSVVAGCCFNFHACLDFLYLNNWWVLECAMEGVEKKGKEGSMPVFFPGKEGRTWAKVVGGQPRQLA